MTVKVIVFDFDGTLADTLSALIRVINRLAGEFGYQPATQQEIEQLQALTSREIIRKSGISIFKIPFLLRRTKLEFTQEIETIQLFLGIPEILNKLSQKGYKLGIITSNSQNNVLKILEREKSKDVFDFIHAGNTLFGKHRAIIKFMYKEKLQPQELIYVGDETRDIEAAKKSQVKVISVSWGFNSRQALIQQNPDFIIDQPQQLLEVIENLEAQSSLS